MVSAFESIPVNKGTTDSADNEREETPFAVWTTVKNRRLNGKTSGRGKT